MINISWEWVVLISGVSFCVGIILYVLSERIGRKQKITDAREEIIQEAIDNVWCSHRREDDPEYSIDHKGTEAIHKILEGLI